MQNQSKTPILRHETIRESSPAVPTAASSPCKPRLQPRFNLCYTSQDHTEIKPLNYIIMAKKFFLAAALLAATVSTSLGQVNINEHGKVVFGPLADSIPINTEGFLLGDSISTAIFLGPGEDYSGGIVSFGAESKVYVGEHRQSLSRLPTSTNMLRLHGELGTILTCRNRPVLAFKCSPTSTAVSNLLCYTSVAAYGFITSSDYRLKRDIENVDEAYLGLWELNPVSYRLNSSVATSAQQAVADSAETATSEVSGNDDRLRYGFIAQEVREIFPDLVVEDEEGMLGIDYQGFIPLLVEAVKDLRAEVAMLKGEDGPAKKQSKEADVKDVLTGKGAYLGQNRPNPFNAHTEIECHVPEDATSAFLYIFDLQGQLVESINIQERGESKVSINGAKLQAGMYLYSLVIDGTEIDTRRMILTD